jgi:xylulokinase
LRTKLPPLAKPWQVIGSVGPYFVKKYGLNPAAQALVWSGDNPCSAIGLGLIREGVVAISLGTSYTYFGRMKRCRIDVRGEGSVFGAPTGDYLPLTCFTNGSLARERIRDQYGLDWEGYNQLLLKTKPGNNGAILLPWFEPEIVPHVARPSVYRFDFNDKNAPAQNCRAIVEAQMMSMRIHSAWMKIKPTSIYATGGGSVNLPVLQIMADVFNCPVHRIEVSKSAALGAALRATHGWLLHSGKKPKWQEVVAVFTEPIPNSEVKPVSKSVRIYNKLVEKYAACESRILNAGLVHSRRS